MQVGTDPIRELRRRQLDDRTPPELLADHRGALQDRLLLGLEAIEARGEQGVDRGRDRQLPDVARDPAVAVEHEGAVVDEHADELLDEERVAVGGALDVRCDRRVQLRGAEQVREQGVDVVAVERLERQVVAGPARTELEQLRPCQREHEHRRAVAPADEVLDQVEQRRFRPVQILEQEDERPRPGHDL